MGEQQEFLMTLHYPHRKETLKLIDGFLKGVLFRKDAVLKSRTLVDDTHTISITIMTPPITDMTTLFAKTFLDERYFRIGYKTGMAEKAYLIQFTIKEL